MKGWIVLPTTCGKCAIQPQQNAQKINESTRLAYNEGIFPIGTHIPSSKVLVPSSFFMNLLTWSIKASNPSKLELYCSQQYVSGRKANGWNHRWFNLIYLNWQKGLTCNSHYCTDYNFPEPSNSPGKSQKRKELVHLRPSKPVQIPTKLIVNIYRFNCSREVSWSIYSVGFFVIFSSLYVKFLWLCYLLEGPPTFWDQDTSRKLNHL